MARLKKETGQRELLAPSDWMLVSWDRHQDQRLTISASPSLHCSLREETGKKVHIPFRDQGETTFKEMSRRL